MNSVEDKSINCQNTGVQEIPEGMAWSLDMDIYYQINQVCYWWIYNPNPTGTVTLKVTNFYSEQCCDPYRFYMGASFSDHYIGVWSGDLKAQTFSWSVPVMFIYWYSDYGYDYDDMDFELTYTP